MRVWDAPRPPAGVHSGIAALLQPVPAIYPAAQLLEQTTRSPAVSLQEHKRGRNRRDGESPDH